MADRQDDELSKSDRIALRISVVQTVLAVSGLFVGAIALYAALSQADAARKQVEASVWPNVQIAPGNYDSETGEEVFRVIGMNSGIGPAKLKAVRVTLDGAPQKSWYSAFRSMTGLESVRAVNSFMTGRVLRAGEQVDFIYVRDEAARLVNARLTDETSPAQLGWEVCYCSVFDQCWMTSSDEEEFKNPRSVGQCPNFGEEAFLN